MINNLIEINAEDVIGKVDYKKLEPIIESKMQKFGIARLLIDIGTLEGIKLVAFWEDLKISLNHSGKYRKIAVVGKSKPESILTKPLAPLLSIEIRLFKNKSSAKRWVLN